MFYVQCVLKTEKEMEEPPVLMELTKIKDRTASIWISTPTFTNFTMSGELLPKLPHLSIGNGKSICIVWLL